MLDAKAQAELETALSEHQFGVRAISWAQPSKGDGGRTLKHMIAIETHEGVSLLVGLADDAFEIVCATVFDGSAVSGQEVASWVGRRFDLLGTLLSAVSPAYVQRFHSQLLAKLEALAPLSHDDDDHHS